MHNTLSWSHQLATHILEDLAAVMRPAIQQVLHTFGQPEASDVFLAQYAVGFDPEPLGLAHIFKRSPYHNPEQFQADFKAAVARGWLAERSPGAYGPTPSARAFVADLQHATAQRLAALAPQPESELNYLVDLLGRVTTAALELPDLAETPALRMSRRFNQAGQPAMLRLRRALIDLLSFRDDAHVAAWVQYEIDGYAWEAFTLLWRGTACTPQDLAETLAARAYTATDYAAALARLAERGWVRTTGTGYEVTPEGGQLRQAVEDLTDQYYNAAFAALAPAELDDLHQRLTTLAQALPLAVPDPA